MGEYVYRAPLSSKTVGVAELGEVKSTPASSRACPRVTPSHRSAMIPVADKKLTKAWPSMHFLKITPGRRDRS